MTMVDKDSLAKHFIERRIEADLADAKYNGLVATRFPPEPNGFLHIGHAKSICLNFSMAKQYGGTCNLRFDDTNPVKEEQLYIDAIKEDIKWLGFTWNALHHTSDYFERLYELAVALIEQEHAYVCSLTADEVRQMRGTLQEPGQNSPYRQRSVADNLELFAAMRAGNYPDGKHTLRAKIDMQSGNLNMRDPVLYRVLHATHPHTGNAWCIYPTYDYAHCLSDGIERITHSLCTLEFQDHRPLYDWLVAILMPEHMPQQIEFSRLNVSHTITSKRKLKELVDAGLVDGWDDPRMPTIRGMRRRGYTPTALKSFCVSSGISKSDSLIDMKLLEEALRDDLNVKAKRAMCVLKPLKVTLSNLPEQQWLTAANHPQDESMGTRELPLTKTIYIEEDDFMEEPIAKYKRLAPGREVRLRYGYVIKCDEVIKDATGRVVELICSCDLDTLGKSPVGRKVKGVIHWVSATDNLECEVHVFDRLFKLASPTESPSLRDALNPESKTVLNRCYAEVSLQDAKPEDKFQFERQGYFVRDRFATTDKVLVFNKAVGLRDSWG